jgi:CBS domain-containing protein
LRRTCCAARSVHIFNIAVAGEPPAADDGDKGGVTAKGRHRQQVTARAEDAARREARRISHARVPRTRTKGGCYMNVKNILSQKGSDVLTLEPTATLADVMDILAKRRIGALVITGADRRIVGIVSERDVVRALAEHGTGILQSPVSETMTRKVVTCGQNETIAEIMGRMTAGKFRHVPVVDQGRLIGIVSIGDIVKARLEELEQEHDALRDYIRTA